MPVSVGFLIQSVGLSVASVTWAHIAVVRVTTSAGNLRDYEGYDALDRIRERGEDPYQGSEEFLYTVRSSGGGGTAIGPIVVGAAATMTFMGFQFPDVHRGKPFPESLSGKWIEIDVEGTLRLGGLIPVSFGVSRHRSLERGFQDLYSWRGPMPMFTTFFGGVAVSGFAEERNLREGTAWGDFTTVMRCQGRLSQPPRPRPSSPVIRAAP